MYLNISADCKISSTYEKQAVNIPISYVSEKL